GAAFLPDRQSLEGAGGQRTRAPRHGGGLNRHAALSWPCNNPVVQSASSPMGKPMQKRILIVEDEASIREMVAFALRKADMLPIHAEDAKSAQLAIADQAPDLILLDWMLPGTSGLALARRLTREDDT